MTREPPMAGERLTAAALRKIAFWACVGAAFPLVPWWVTMGADWFAKTYVCGPMPARGIFDPMIGSWFRCVDMVTLFGTMAPICATAAGYFAWLGVRFSPGRRALEEAGDA